MKTQTSILIVLLFATHKLAFSQVNFNTGLEVGLNSSGWFNKYSYTNHPRADVTSITTQPIISPVFGAFTKICYGRHFYANFGLQYFWVGNKYYSNRQGITYFKQTFTSEKWENQTFQKLSVPFSIGYNFRIWKIHPNIFIGIKKEYFTKGNYSYKSVYSEENSEDINRAQTSDPFNKTDYNIIANRWNTAIFAGLGAKLTNRLCLNFSYAINQEIFYGNTFGWETNGHFYHNHDMALSLKYNILPY